MIISPFQLFAKRPDGEPIKKIAVTLKITYTDIKSGLSRTLISEDKYIIENGVREIDAVLPFTAKSARIAVR